MVGENNSSKKSSGENLETLEDLLDIANALALAIAASHGSDDSKITSACSFVSTQGKQIQVVYEKLFKSGDIKLPPVTCWTSHPLFLTQSQSTLGATFYFEYLAHAKTISSLIERNIVGGAISNMVAWMSGQDGKSVQFYLDIYTSTPFVHSFFRPISCEVAAKIVAMPGVKTLKQTPGMFFELNALSEYIPELSDEPIIIGCERGQYPEEIFEFGRKWLFLVDEKDGSLRMV